MKSASFTFKVVGPTPRDSVSIFHSGQGFFLAAQRCLTAIAVGPGKVQVLPSAGVANLCFAIELFLKSLYVLLGKEPPRTHKLEDLVKQLPKDELNGVRGMYSQMIQEPTFDALLHEITEFFVKLRYEYEFDIFSLNDHAVFVLGDALYRHCAVRNKSESVIMAVNV